MAVKHTVKTIIVISLVLVFLLPAASWAQHPNKVSRVGYISGRPAEQENALFPAFVEALRELGYADGKNIIIEHRHAAQRAKLRELATELVRLNVEVIVASGSQEVVKEVTATIPIVFVPSADPVGEGLVQSLARPGGNLTGLSDLHGHLVSKRLELVKETVPSAARIAFLWNSATAPGALQLKELQAAAPVLGVTLLSYGVKQPDDSEPRLATWPRSGFRPSSSRAILCCPTSASKSSSSRSKTACRRCTRTSSGLEPVG